MDDAHVEGLAVPARTPRSVARLTGAMIVVLGLAGLGVAATGVRLDAQLARDYGSALAATDTTWEAGRAANVHLTRNEVAPVLARALSVGDRITVSGHDGRADSIEVLSLEHVDGSGIGLPGTHLQIVTGHPTSGGSGETVRFLFAVEPGRSRGQAEKVL